MTEPGDLAGYLEDPGQAEPDQATVDAENARAEGFASGNYR